MPQSNEELIAEAYEAYEGLMNSVNHDQYPADIMLSLISALKEATLPKPPQEVKPPYNVLADPAKFVDHDQLIENLRLHAEQQRKKIKSVLPVEELLDLSADTISALAARLNNLTIPKAKIHILTPNEKFLWDQYNDALQTIHELAKQLLELDQLRQWKEEALELLGPVLDYAAQTPGIQLGDSVIEKMLAFLTPKRVPLRKAEQKALDWLVANVPKSPVTLQLVEEREKFNSQLGKES